MLSENGFVIEESKLIKYMGAQECVVLPQGIETISVRAFEGNLQLRQVVFSDSVKTIGERAFAGCENLEEIILNQGLKRLGSGCFANCMSLRRVQLPESVLSIRSGAFFGCPNLKEIKLPKELCRGIEEDTFASCDELWHIELPASVENIGFCAFRDCENLREVVFENENIRIERGAFVGCRALGEQVKQFISAHAFSRVKVDIRSSSPGAAGRLSNFTAREFEFDGVKCGSIEGVLQSFKCEDELRQREICALSGNQARLAGREYDWREKQTLYWQGVSYPRKSEEYRQLITRLYDAVYAQDESFRADLARIRGREITHRLGHADPEKTILTKDEFTARLERFCE